MQRWIVGFKLCAVAGLVILGFMVAVGSIVFDSDSSDSGNDWPGYRFMTGSIDGCDGAVAYNKWEYEDGAEATLIFANGRTEYTDKYHHLIELFDRPWDIIMFDHFGQGRSDGVRAHADDFDTQHVCNMQTVIDALAAADLPRVVIAHSMGGMIAARLAQRFPDIAEAFVFSSPMFGVPIPEPFTRDEAQALAAANVAAGLGEEPTGPPSPRPSCAENDVTHDCELYDQFVDDPITMIGEYTWGWGNSALATIDRMFADIANITKPVLIFQAGEENVVRADRQDEFCDALNQVRDGACRLRVFEDDLHELFNELDRDVVVQEALEFLDEAL